VYPCLRFESRPSSVKQWRRHSRPVLTRISSHRTDRAQAKQGEVQEPHGRCLETPHKLDLTPLEISGSRLA
jgi:hypothetical protein